MALHPILALEHVIQEYRDYLSTASSESPPMKSGIPQKPMTGLPVIPCVVLPNSEFSPATNSRRNRHHCAC